MGGNLADSKGFHLHRDELEAGLLGQTGRPERSRKTATLWVVSKKPQAFSVPNWFKVSGQ